MCRAEIVRVDVQNVSQVEAQLEEFVAEMEKDFKFHFDRLDNTLHQMQHRADAFLDDKVQITNVVALMQTEKMRNDFEKQVIGDTLT